MSITAVSIQGLLTNQDGSPASGTVTATPNSLLANGGQLTSTAPVCGIFDPLGRIVAQSLYALTVGATDDTGTTPVGSAYSIAIKLDGEPITEFLCAMPHASTATETDGTTTLNSPVVILSELVAAESMAGQPITGTNIPGGTTVLSVQTDTNSLTLSANATASTLLTCSFVVGGAVEIATLYANAL